MSELLEQIKKDQLLARKDRDTFMATALTTLIGEASASGFEETTDQKVQAVIKKFVKNLDEMLKYNAGDKTYRENILEEIALYKSYLPKQITGDDLDELIENLITYDGCDNIGKVMKALNGAYTGQFDGKEASTIAKKYF